MASLHAVGSTLLQVCQPRQPCFKFALRLENNSLPKAMVRSGRSGWYYRVLQTGTVSAGDTVIFHARPKSDFPFLRLLAVINHGDASTEELARMAELLGLAGHWQAHARQVLQQGRSTP